MTILETAPNPDSYVDLPRPGAWVIRWRGSQWSDGDVTGQHLATLALLSGNDDFASLDVDPRHGHQRLMSMIMALVCVQRAGQGATDAEDVADTLAVAIEEVATASVDEILGSLIFS